MLTLKLIEIKDNIAYYEYFPEDNSNAPGKVGLNLESKERLFVEDSADDFGKRYAAHALKRIEEYSSNKDFKEKDLVAWY